MKFPYESLPPSFVLLKNALTIEECEHIIKLARKIGWESGGVVGDKKSKGRKSQVAFLHTKRYLKRCQKLGYRCAQLLDISVAPEKLTFFQVSKYKRDGYYNIHQDHVEDRHHSEDISRVGDRKLSISISLSSSHVVFIQGSGLIRLGKGDMIAFTSICSHRCPSAKELKENNIEVPTPRYSLVAWIQGPKWS